MTGDALIAEEPAQAGFDTRTEAPKSANKQANDKAELDVKPIGDAATAVIALESRAATTGTKAADGLVTVRAKPEKRKNYKERAKAKFAKEDTKDDTRDGTTPMTATAKSGVQSSAKDNGKDKAEKAKLKAEEKAAQKAQKADTKAAKIKAAKAAKEARAA